MNKNIKLILGICMILSILIAGCSKEETLEEKAPIDYLAGNKDPKTDLDKLIDTIANTYGVRVMYQFDPRVIDPTTFYTPTTYDRALFYTKHVVRTLWLEPLTKNFPVFIQNQKPVEFLIVGSAIKFNSISSGGAAGAGLNAQFYRLGMGAVDTYGNNPTKATLRSHICTLYHEHAHQMDAKFGRSYAFDRVSQGLYYQLNYQTKPDGRPRTDTDAQKDGFFNAYAGFAPEEDFATAVEYMIKYSKADILKFVALNPKLETKYKMVYQFYLDKGVDLHKMHEVLNEVANALPLR
jgi:substrate import-associated zinc metallohydrolase lipoprotein